jgi:hypothetical protein
MGSMIQNEISSIKEASIKAAQESSDWLDNHRLTQTTHRNILNQLEPSQMWLYLRNYK